MRVCVCNDCITHFQGRPRVVPYVHLIFLFFEFIVISYLYVFSASQGYPESSMTGSDDNLSFLIY